MIKNFNNLKESGIRYGGHAGNKLGVVIDGANWFLKFPKSTRTLRKKVDMSYSISPLSEYIGSHIYKSVDIPVHKTMLGIRDNKLVVACKDFRNDISKIIIPFIIFMFLGWMRSFLLLPQVLIIQLI